MKKIKVLAIVVAVALGVVMETLLRGGCARTMAKRRTVG